MHNPNVLPPTGRCPVCYRPKKKNGRKYCCYEHYLIARRVRERMQKAAKIAAGIVILPKPVKPYVLPKVTRKIGRKIINCIMCGAEFGTTGVIVGGQVVPNERTCPLCRKRRDLFAQKYDETCLTSPLAMVYDGWSPRGEKKGDCKNA